MSTIIVILAATLPMVICDQDARNQLFNDYLGMDTMEGLSGGKYSINYPGFWREFSKFTFYFWLHGISH